MNSGPSKKSELTAIPSLLIQKIESLHFSSKLVDFASSPIKSDDSNSSLTSDPTHSTESPFVSVDRVHIYLPHSLERAVFSRKQEYLAGRKAAYLALKDVGYEDGSKNTFELLSHASRAPVWPNGYMGSIAHTKNRAWAVCAKSDSGFVSIGIDMETSIHDRTNRDISSKIWTSAESKLLSGQMPPSLSLTTVFAAKEALFKALNPLTQTYFDFLDAEVIAIQFENKDVSPFGSLRLMLLCDLPSEKRDPIDPDSTSGAKWPVKPFLKHSTFSVYFQIVESFQVFAFLTVEPS